jgi:hypothetical protein
MLRPLFAASFISNLIRHKIQQQFLYCVNYNENPITGIIDKAQQ